MFYNRKNKRDNSKVDGGVGLSIRRQSNRSFWCEAENACPLGPIT